jgi:hypothetical protein
MAILDNNLHFRLLLVTFCCLVFISTAHRRSNLRLVVLSEVPQHARPLRIFACIDERCCQTFSDLEYKYPLFQAQEDHQPRV